MNVPSKKEKHSLGLAQLKESRLRRMKKINEDLKVARGFNKGCISLLRYIVLQDEYKTGEGVIFLRHLICVR